MTTRLLALIADAVESKASASTSANPTVPGYWKRIAAGAEALAGATTTANSDTAGYLKRAAVALENVGGTSGTSIDLWGYVARMVAALEAANSTTYTGSWLERFRLAMADFTPGGWGMTKLDFSSAANSGYAALLEDF